MLTRSMVEFRQKAELQIGAILTAISGDMGTHMKTTFDISDALLDEVKKRAATDGVTVKSLVELGLRRVLAEQPRDAGFRLRRASFKGRGLQAGVAGASWDALRALAYEGRGA
ncbi:MAG: hypothetical protein KF778_01535 [Rhodocyclaceae bacterium]|nr:hypothetical protein [Rhodocyclaceae bacterium]MBX3667057.1 hypothetical protein [Rhodocyclaceae bacterium]